MRVERTLCARVYLGEKGLVDLHPLVRALRKHLSATMPAVAHGRVGVGHTAQEHRPLVVELLFSLSYTLVHRHHGVVQVCRTKVDKQIPYHLPGERGGKIKTCTLKSGRRGWQWNSYQHAGRGRCLTGGESCLSR